MLPLCGTKPGIVRAPSEAMCGKWWWRDASPGEQKGESGTTGTGCPSNAGTDAAGLWWCPGVELADGGFELDLG